MSPPITDNRYVRRKCRIFLSHTSTDEPAASYFIHRFERMLALRSVFAEFFYTTDDHYRFTLGAQRTCDQALQQYLHEHMWISDAFVLVFTNRLIDQERPWVKWEMREAIKRSASLPPYRKFIFPCVKGCSQEAALASDFGEEFFGKYVAAEERANSKRFSARQRDPLRDELFGDMSPRSARRFTDALAVTLQSFDIVPPRREII